MILAGLMSMVLGWTVGAGAEATVIETGTQSGVYTQEADFGPETTGTLTGLQSGTTYYARAFSYNEYGESAPGDELTFTPGCGRLRVLGVQPNGNFGLLVMGSGLVPVFGSDDFRKWDLMETAQVSGTLQIEDNSAGKPSRFYTITPP